MTPPQLAAEPVFVVWRAARGVPPGWMSPDLEGRWDNRADLLAKILPPRATVLGAVAFPTSRLEHRDSDGATAQVWEVHPPGGNYANDDDDLWVTG